MSALAPSPLSGPISPAPAIVLPAAPAAPATSTPAPAPAAAPASQESPAQTAVGAHELTAADLRLAQEMGLYGQTPAPADATLPQIPETETLAAEVTVEETPAEKRARLQAELAALDAETTLAPEGAPPAPGEAAQGETPATPEALALDPIAPPPEAPLINLRAEADFALAQKSAQALKAWAYKNRDGGEVPVELAQLAENAEAARVGRAPRQITAPVFLTGDQSTDLHNAAEETLTVLLPARREAAAGEQQLLAAVKRQSPAFFDGGKSDEGRIVSHVLKSYPQLRTIPYWPMMVRHMAMGYLADQAAAQAQETAAPAPAEKPALRVLPKPTVPTTDGQQVPLAPSPAIGGRSTGRPPLSEQRLRAIEKTPPTQREEADWLQLAAAAV